jgi:hypothetical protein
MFHVDMCHCFGKPKLAKCIALARAFLESLQIVVYFLFTWCAGRTNLTSHVGNDLRVARLQLSNFRQYVSRDKE